MAYSLNYFSPSKESNTSRKKEVKLVQQIVPGPVLEALVKASRKERKDMKDLILSKMGSVNITEIKKVKNSFLEAMYELKKEEYKTRHSGVKEELLIHVTSASNVTSIIQDNFDWRKISRGKFGRGTSFSGDPAYADKYANINIGPERAFIITKVLISKSILGNYGMKIPPRKFDTSTGNGHKVYVKYCDYEILPQFVVYYYNADYEEDEDDDDDEDEDDDYNYGYNEYRSNYYDSYDYSD